MNLKELGATTGCEVKGNSQHEILGVAPLSSATPNQVSFFTNEKYLSEALSSKAGAIICSARNETILAGKVVGVLLVSPEPYVSFAKASQVFFSYQHPFSGKSANAHIDSSAQLDASVTIFPFVFIGPGARIEKNVVLYSGVFVGAGSSIGEGSIIYPNAVIREGSIIGKNCLINPGVVIGGDGFGFAPSSTGENIKIPQVGSVILADEVEVGSNSSIDRGAMANTTIGKHTKIDSLVQIGHNVVVGESCFIAALVGIAGSSKIGKKVTLAGQVGVSGHIEIGENSVVLAKAGVTKNVPPGALMAGMPARPNKDFLNQQATLSRLSKRKKIKDEV